jgi:general secretion pathway protein G
LIIIIKKKAFTLVEIMVVVIIISVLLTFFIPELISSWQSTKKDLAKTQLYTLRKVIHQYAADMNRYPEDFAEILRVGYIKEIPLNPLTNGYDWQVRPFGLDPLVDSSWNYYVGKDGKIFSQNRNNSLDSATWSSTSNAWYTNNFILFDIRIPDELDPTMKIDDKWSKMPIE